MEAAIYVKSIFQQTKEQLGWKVSGPPDILIIDGKYVISQRRIAEEQINYFHKKIRELIQNLPVIRENPLSILQEAMESWKGRDGRSLFKLKPRMETIQLLKELGQSKAFGHDTIDTMALKFAASSMHIPS